MKEPIAIVGSGCRFPGASSSPSRLWELLRDPKDVLSEFTQNRLNLSSFYHPNGEHHGSTDVQNKSYLLSEDHRLFDAPFFNISPLEADGMDPQQRILLETVYEALESAGCTLEEIQGSLTSVHVGVMNADYFDIQSRDTETMPTYNATGTVRSILSNRISYFFDLKGPSMTIDTACSSSLVALHQAVQSLRNGDATTALVAGANLILDPAMYIAESKLHMLSPNSVSRMWDKSADGYARGEGFAALFLKPLNHALKDGNHIEGIVRETGVNSDGRTKGITMPSATAQTALIQQTYRNAGLDPLVDRCQYFECHGTGTLAGDPVEARAIQESFFPIKGPKDQLTDPEKADKLFVGSIKTVIGHLEGCAGLAGVLKALLAIKHRTIPPNMYFDELNPVIAPYYDRLQVPVYPMPWPEIPGTPLRASVNSFGFGGTNAHAIIESYEPEVDKVQPNRSLDHHSSDDNFVGPMVFSANTGSSLLATVKDFTKYIKLNPSVRLEDLAWVLQTKRTTFPVKHFFSGATRQSLLGFMDKLVEMAEAGPRVEVGTRTNLTDPNELPAILGIFTGQGAQWASMGRGLILSSPLFRESIERCEASLACLPDAPDWSLKQELMADEATSRLSEAALSQPLCTALQIAMVDLLSAAGIKLSALVGHSSGEIAAAYAAGILSATGAMQIAYYRGYHAKLARGAQGQSGAMMAVGLSLEGALSFCAQPMFAGRIAVAASNSPLTVTLSGDADAVNEAKEYFDHKKTFARLLKVDTAYHSHHMHPCSEPYLESLKACNIQVNPPRSDCVWVSSVRGDTELLEGDLEELKGQYWVDNMLKTVLFSQAVEASLWNGGPFNVVVELGPHPALKGPAEQTFKSVLGSSTPYAGFMRRGDSEVEAFSGGVGFVWSYLGPSSVDFDGYRRAYQVPNAPEPRMLKDLPSYAWDHDKIHWRESRISRKYRLRNHQHQELLGRRVPDDSEYEMRWRNILRLNEIPWIRGHLTFQARALIIGENHAGVETVFTVKLADQNFVASDDAILQAEFAYYTCSDEATGSLVKTCGGRLLVHIGQPSTQGLPRRPLETSNLVPVDIERFYNSMANVGLNYQGLFQGLSSGKRTVGYASASASWPDMDMGEEYLIHPAFLDVAFQSLYAAFSSPNSDSLWTPYLPIRIRRLVMDPNAEYRRFSGEVKIDIEAFVTDTNSTLLEGDVHIYDLRENQTGLQVEGLAMKAFADAEASNDRLLFAETIWDTDSSFGLTNLIEQKEDVEEVELVDALERIALYYYQALFREVTPDEIKGFKWYHQRMFEAADVLLASIRNGQHPAAKREWLKDSRSTIIALTEKYSERIDFKLMHAIGENLASVVRGETQLLEVMLQDNMLNRFYMEGCGFPVVNKQIAHAVKQITHKHPQAVILEVGAGTGGTTRSVLDTIGNAYSAYTYTDISTGFFENAAEKFHDHNGKMVFKVLDAEKDAIEQGFAAESYDIIIAANVLHATRNLSETMQHVRSLLRPGGYLILMEITGPEILRTQFLMGGLPGWWLGADEGRRLSPAISPVQWDELLRTTGFSGVDSIFHDMSDALKHSYSLIVSQAINEEFMLLRDPLASIDSIPEEQSLLIIGGKSLPTAKTARDIQKLLSPWKHCTTIVNSIESLNTKSLRPMTSIICLEELDRPIFSEPMTPARMKSLQELFINAKNVLWITAGRMSESPLCNMTVGVGRALLSELPHVNLQFLDFSTKANLNARTLAEVFLRLQLATTSDHAGQNILWKTEPELAVDGEVVHIPRVLPSKTLNDRYNASRRLITKNVSTDDVCVEIVASRESLSLVEKKSLLNHSIPSGYTSIRVRYSMALPYPDRNPCYLCLGLLGGTEQEALVISQSNSSTIEVRYDDIFVLQKTQDCDAATLQAVANHLIATALLSKVPASGSILVYEPGEALAAAFSYNSHWKEHEVFFASSKQSDIPKGWIAIHPQASQRAIKHYLPRNIACLIDFSNSQSREIKSCLSPNCAMAKFEPSLIDEITHSLTRHDLLAESYRETTTYMPKLGNSTTEHVVSVQDLSGASSSAQCYPIVVDWSMSNSLSVAIKPLDPTGLFSSTKTYFMVGMTGELGQSICRWMAQNGARYIVLTSRNADVNVVWLSEMRELGATVKTHKMDVSDRDSVRSVYGMVRDSMPPIAGVCNAAMVLSDRLFVDMDADTMNNTIKPKVDGTKHLDELFAQTPLDFFVLFSSLASVIGNGGQSNYHAANLFMESMAARRRERGLSASVINIGMVTDVGYVARRGRATEEHLRNLFFMPLSESDVHHLFAEAVRAGHPGSDGQSQIIMGVQPFRDSPDAGTRPPWYSNPRFSHFVLGENVSKERRQTNPNAVDTRQRLENAESEDSATLIVQESFSLKLESMMQLAPNSVNANVPLLDLGCDSLLAVEVRTWFLKEIHVDVPVLKVLSGDTVAQICNDAARKYLASKLLSSQKAPPNISTEIKDIFIKNSEKAISRNIVNDQADERNGSRTPESESDVGSADESFRTETTQNLNFDSLPSTPARGLESSRTMTPAAEYSKEIDHNSVSFGKDKSIKRAETMSYAQSRIWFLTKYLRDPTTYNVTVAYNVKGNLQVSRFRRALAATISHHESLQTCFFTQPEGGELMQGILTSPLYLLKHVHISDKKLIEREFEQLKNHTWDLEQGQTFGATLISQAPDLHTIIFGYHHIIMDGVSWHYFLRDLDLAYQMRPLKRGPKEYVDFSVENIRSVEAGEFTSQIEFWQREHAKLPDVIPLLPIARVRARKAMDSYDSHVTSKEISQDLVIKIKRASQALRATPFHFHLAVIQVIFSRLLGIEDLCIGVADANRNDDTFAETVGFFLNLLPLRFSVGNGENFSELVKRTSKKIFAALANSNVPFDLVLEKLNVPRSPAYSPLFQIAVNYRMGAMLQTPLGDCQLEIALAEDARNPYDLSFGITETSTGTCLLELTCRNYLYTTEASNLLMNTYVCLLETLSTNTSLEIQDCPLSNPKNLSQVISIGKGPRVQYDWPETLSEKFDAIRQSRGDYIAVKDNLRALTYSQLAEEVDNIAATILDRSLAPESRIAVLCQPSAESIACMLAILRAGCVYVPLDLSLPPGRHVAILENCKPSLILCHPATLEMARGYSLTNMTIINISNLDCNHMEVKNVAQPNSPAFLLYTSGSTGVPKGIFLSQANFVNHLAVKVTELSIGEEVVMQQSSFGFDMSIVQTFCALANGGTLVVVPQNARGDPVEISKLMWREEVTFTIATPSEYLMMLRYGDEFLQQYSTWRHACMGGETVTEQLIREFQRVGRSDLSLTNCYGPTEITAAASFQNMPLTSGKDGTSDDFVSVGKTLPNYSIYIIDEECKLLPGGFPGEICIGGAGVALGYLDLPEQTQAKFLPDPFAAPEDIAKGWTRMYRSGDKGRFLPDGSLLFIGRIEGDTQIKLRGLRIELDGVANTLLQAASGLLTEAVVTVRGDPQFLVAHVVFVLGESLSDAELQLLARNLPLPQYMCPAAIVPVQSLPRNSNGKIDRKAIESLALPIQRRESQPQEHLTLSEGELRLLWEKILQQTASSPRLRSDSDFFMVGGNSLLLVKLQRAIKEAIGVAISLTELYQACTLGRMATRINAMKEQLPGHEAIDWVVETAIPDSMLLAPRPNQEPKRIKTRDREVFLTGSTSFLGAAILQSLLENASVGRIHCVAVPMESQNALHKSDKIVIYTGSLLAPTLGLAEAECVKLQSCVDLIIHVGANGHCLNNYSSLRVPNFHSTRFLATLALPRSIPVQFLSSNRVSLLSGCIAVPPISLSSYPPATDGSEGFTATKWASERFLEDVAQQTGLEVCVHRACAVIGDKAPNEDALNALLLYSTLTRAVPRFDNFEGFFDFKDVNEVAEEIAKEALGGGSKTGIGHKSIRFRHYSSGVKVPVQEFRQHMELTHGCRFEELSIADWIEKAMIAGIDPLITSYLEALVERRGKIAFPYLGEVISA